MIVLKISALLFLALWAFRATIRAKDEGCWVTGIMAGLLEAGAIASIAFIVIFLLAFGLSAFI